MADQKEVETRETEANYEGTDQTTAVPGKNMMKERKISWAKLRRVDSLNIEAGRVSSSQGHGSKESWKRTLSLAFQSIGVIYGDIGTSPLYVYKSTFIDGIQHQEDILGVLSLIIYTIALMVMLKYVFIVLWANDNGDGGTFALYSLLCRYAKVSMIPNQEPEDRELSNYRLETPSNQWRRASKVKEKLENSKTAQILLFLVTIMGTSMVIGDGILTPSISVLSAVDGINSLGKNAVVGISVAILIVLFSVQRFGTDKVGMSFAPIIFTWFSVISGIGLYNLFKYEFGVLRAFNPAYIIDYLKRNGKRGWISLGGVFLCITGTEAMFADLGHFNVRAVQFYNDSHACISPIHRGPELALMAKAHALALISAILFLGWLIWISFSFITFPALLTAYIGQAAYLRKFPGNVDNTFYDSIPDRIYWPTFVVAVAAAIIASQAMISGAFAILSQSQNLGCFPRIKVVHTSAKYEGQVYIPEANYLLMIACVIVTVAFKTTDKIGNAYGIAVVSVMLITTCMLTLIMLVIWKTRIWKIALFFVVFASIEGIYLSSVLSKFTQGGFLPLVFALVLMTIMAIWHYVHKERYMFELRNKVSNEFINELAVNPNIKRVPGMGFLYSELVQGIPPIFSHFISNIPSIHSVLVCVSIKSIPISKVVLEERFLFRQVEPREYHMFRCVVRYGYNDVIEEAEEFELLLVEQLKEFIRHEHFMLEEGTTEQIAEPVNLLHSSLLVKDGKERGSTVHTEESLQQPKPSGVSSGSNSIQSVNAAKSTNSSNRIVSVPTQGVGVGVEEEMQFIQKAMENGVVYLLGEAEVVAEQKSSFLKKIIVNHAYSFLRKNFRQGEKVLAIPHARLVRVGMTYEI